MWTLLPPHSHEVPLDLPQSQALEKGTKIERGEEGLLTSGDDVEGGPSWGRGGHLRISLNSPVDEQTEFGEVK